MEHKDLLGLDSPFCSVLCTQLCLSACYPRFSAKGAWACLAPVSMTQKCSRAITSGSTPHLKGVQEQPVLEVGSNSGLYLAFSQGSLWKKPPLPWQ